MNGICSRTELDASRRGVGRFRYCEQRLLILISSLCTSYQKLLNDNLIRSDFHHEDTFLCYIHENSANMIVASFRTDDIIVRLEMPSWQDEYLAALKERDKWEKANAQVFQQCQDDSKLIQIQSADFIQDTKLADRTAALDSLEGDPDESAAGNGKPLEPALQSRKSNVKDGKGATPPPAVETLGAIRKDLGEAQRSRSLAETRLQSVTEELKKLKIQSSLDNSRIRELVKEKAALSTGLRDRDEELKGKRKLLEVSFARHIVFGQLLKPPQDMHDETVSMTLQLNMADEQSEKLRRENKDLVDRWMKKMAQEADAMNDKSKFS